MGETVLVIGGSGGIGAAIVRALAARGHATEFTYRSSAEAAQRLAAEARAAATQCDLADRASVDALAAAIEARDEAPYGLVYNAGATYDALAAVLDQDRAEQVMQVNFWAMARMVRACVRGMTGRRRGRIVLMSSLTALRGSRGNASYAASKAAQLGYLNALVGEVAKRGVTVNAITPGFVDTEMMAPYADHRAKLEAQIPAGRFGKPEEIAGLVAFLLSPEAAYINGAVIPVDGGLGAVIAAQR
jgi:NAD(P)-dependent dehydrogenase (short-subunit alcohol dehydrogenase family)